MDPLQELFERAFEIGAQVDDLESTAPQAEKDSLIAKLRNIAAEARSLPEKEATDKQRLQLLDVVGGILQTLGATPGTANNEVVTTGGTDSTDGPAEPPAGDQPRPAPLMREFPPVDQWLEARYDTEPLVKRLRELYDRYNSYPDMPEGDSRSPAKTKWRGELDELIVAICATEILLALEAGGGTPAVDSEKLLDLLTVRVQAIGPVLAELAETNEELAKLLRELQAAKAMYDDAYKDEQGRSADAWMAALNMGSAALVGGWIESERAEQVARKHGLLDELKAFRADLNKGVAELLHEVVDEGVRRIHDAGKNDSAKAMLRDWTPHRPRLGADHLITEVEKIVGDLAYPKLLGTDGLAFLRKGFPVTGFPPLYDSVKDIPVAKPGDAVPRDAGDGTGPPSTADKLLTDSPNLFGRLFRALGPLWWLVIVLLLGVGLLWLVLRGDSDEKPAVATEPAVTAAVVDSDDPAPAAASAPPETTSPAPGVDTTITIAVADAFGPEGLRVIPAPGITVEVVDQEGNVVASGLTPDDLDGVTIGVAPGMYLLRLDISGYEPALPAGCTDGYVREFEIAPGDALVFGATVYTTSVADDGTSVSPASGDCITLR